MEIGFAGFLFCVEWCGMEEKERKNENGNILAGQAGMKVAGWREAVRAGMKRYAAKGCWPAGAGREVVITGKCSAL